MPFSSKVWAKYAALGALLLSSAACGAEGEVPTHCQVNERVVFSCRMKDKIVSICASPAAAPYESIEYRFGAKDKVEMTYAATHSNKNRFYAYTEPLAPGAMVREVWFDRGDIRYMVTHCEGGNCPRSAGLIVYRKTKPISTRVCEYDFSAKAAFDPKIIDFGSGFSDSSSKTDLLILENTAYEVESLYPRSRRKPVR